jgi:hypothetical protein
LGKLAQIVNRGYPSPKIEMPSAHEKWKAMSIARNG